jgi:hypothetical protein
MIPGTALRITALDVDEQDPNHVVAATAFGIGSQLARGGIYESTDAGLNWSKLAEADGIVRSLTLNQGMVYAATENGLASYGEAKASAPVIPWPDLRPLTNPTGIQMFILLLTIALAAIALVGRKEWVSGGSQAIA